jgi:TRAP-type C4-dicarboxylate transport system permease small subunit
MRLLSKAGIIFDKVLNIFAFLAGLMVIFMVLAIPYSVIMRYFFLKPPEWVIQTCEYMLLWLTFLASAWLLRDEGHVSVDHLPNLNLVCLGEYMGKLRVGHIGR